MQYSYVIVMIIFDEIFSLSQIHFDAHPDLGSPEMLKEVRSMKLQEIWSDTQKMFPLMESNDRFIIGAALIDIIDHVIWVRPSWREMELFTIIMSVGVVTKVGDNSLCMCMKKVVKTKSKNSSDPPKRKIQIDCETVDYDDEEKIEEIDKKYCKILKSIRFTQDDERHFLKLRSLRNISNWMLDIDEDYFGVKSDVLKPIHYGITPQQIEDINDGVSILYCPTTHDLEMEASEILDQIMEATIRFRSRYRSRVIFTSQVRQLFLERITSPFFCKNTTDLNRHSAAEKLAGIMYNFNPYQLTLIKDMRFCLTSTPTFPEVEQFRFILCTGNPPWMTDGIYYNTTNTEIDNRAKKLGNLLETSMNQIGQPQLITIARSIRDGYTPREFFGKIETNILNTLNNVFNAKSIPLYHVFDENLLFGMRGWT